MQTRSRTDLTRGRETGRATARCGEFHEGRGRGLTGPSTGTPFYTHGIRRTGDAASATLTSAALGEVIRLQQETLREVLEKELDDIPQGWLMYKEVSGYWEACLGVDETVILRWTDDNRENIHRIPAVAESERVGGLGMYYCQCSFVSSPRVLSLPSAEAHRQANSVDFDCMCVGPPRNHK